MAFPGLPARPVLPVIQNKKRNNPKYPEVNETVVIIVDYAWFYLQLLALTFDPLVNIGKAT